MAGTRNTSLTVTPTSTRFARRLKPRRRTRRPSLIKVSTLIGYGSPNKADTHDVHGAPLGKDETEATRKNLNWKYGEFEIPEAVQKAMDCSAKGAELQAEWKKVESAYASKYRKTTLSTNPSPPVSCRLAGLTLCRRSRRKTRASRPRIHSPNCLERFGWCHSGLCWRFRRSCSSNMTLMAQFGDFQKDTPAERNIRYGVREHGMALSPTVLRCTRRVSSPIARPSLSSPITADPR